MQVEVPDRCDGEKKAAFDVLEKTWHEDRSEGTLPRRDNCSFPGRSDPDMVEMKLDLVLRHWQEACVRLPVHAPTRSPQFVIMSSPEEDAGLSPEASSTVNRSGAPMVSHWAKPAVAFGDPRIQVRRLPCYAPTTTPGGNERGGKETYVLCTR